MNSKELEKTKMEIQPQVVSCVLFMIVGIYLFRQGYRTAVLREKALIQPTILEIWIIRLLQGKEAAEMYSSKALDSKNLFRTGKRDLILGVICLIFGVLSLISLFINN